MSDNILIMFKHSYMIVPVIMLLAVLLTFIDSKITQKDVSTSSYIKVSLMSGIFAVLIVYINTIKGFIHEEILTGTPPF